MHDDRFRYDSTRFVDFRDPYAVDNAAVERATMLLNVRRLGDERALGLVVINKSGMVARVVGGPGPLAIAVGRHPGSDLCLPHVDASLRHLVVVADDNGCAVFDLASSMGTAGIMQAPRGGLIVVRTSDSVVVAGVVDAGMPFMPVRAVPAETVRHLVRHAARKKARMPTTLPLSRLRQSSPLSSSLSSSLLIGREPRNDIVTVHDGISRVHAAVVAVVIGGRRQALLIDVGSTNGTAVIQANEGRIVERALGPARRAALIAAGDLVVLGSDTRLTVVGTVDDAAYAATGGMA